MKKNNKEEKQNENSEEDFEETNSNLQVGVIASQSIVSSSSPNSRQTPHFSVEYKSEEFGDDSEENEESEALEDIVLNSSENKIPISKASFISPSLEISDEVQGLETELKNTLTIVPNNPEAQNPPSQYDMNSTYMSVSYQTSNYVETSIYPKTISSQDSANAFDSNTTSFRSPGIFRNNNISSQKGYPNTETRSYEPISGLKRDKRKS